MYGAIRRCHMQESTATDVSEIGRHEFIKCLYIIHHLTVCSVVVGRHLVGSGHMKSLCCLQSSVELSSLQCPQQ